MQNEYMRDETMLDELKYTPTEFVGLVNQTLEFDFGAVVIEGEVASFKVNQGKWVFFDLKDEESSVNCFMPVWNLRIPLEDGMKVVVRGTPKLTRWGKFSLTVTAVQPVGEGSLKKAFMKLKKKLTEEGLFDPAKKRPIPVDLTRLGVISSTGAAGYADFIKILNARWGGIKVEVAHTQVQGLDAPDQIIRALQYFNERGVVQAIAILRGGGSADDLACFNDEALVRAVAASKIPVVTGIGHEVDESLVDLAADLLASTPSNAAELLTRDREAVMTQVKAEMLRVSQNLLERINYQREDNRGKVQRISRGLREKYIEPLLNQNQEKMTAARQQIQLKWQALDREVRQKLKLLEVLNPEKVLRQGYAIINGEIFVDNVVKITTFNKEIKAKIKEIYDRK